MLKAFEVHITPLCPQKPYMEKEDLVFALLVSVLLWFPSSPSLPGRTCSAFFSNFVEEKA
jgi:hypothetical protein